MSELDLAALREACVAAGSQRFLGQHLIGACFVCSASPAVVLSLLDRIEELERQWHVHKHGCHWVDCTENPPYYSVPHNHCPEDCRFSTEPANDGI